MKIGLSLQLALIALILLPCAPSLGADELATQGSQASAFEQTETVKTGDYSMQWQPSWSALRERLVAVNPTMVLTALVAFLVAFGLFAAVQIIFFNDPQKAAPRTKGYPHTKHKKHVSGKKRRGLGLRAKLSIFTIELGMLVVIMVSVPLSYFMYTTQQKTLMQNLMDRCAVWLDGVSASVQAYLPEENIAELSLLPAKMTSIPEARYVTITGMTPGSSVYDDRVWATNDPDIFLKIDTREFQPGVSRLSDSLSPRLETIRRDMDAQADVAITGLSRGVNAAFLEAASNRVLLEMNRLPGSEPEFVFSKTQHRFILFKPIMYRHGPYANYFQGLIRMEISTDLIAAQLKYTESELLETTIYVALFALTLGVLGMSVLSSMIIMPIRKLVRHLEIIRDTDDIERLATMKIPVTSRDEIAMLGNTINEMTQALVKAAGNALDLSLGREIQKKFLPLEIDKHGNKLSSGYMNTKNAVFFGYYEGAKEISGDYFDYKDLDGRYYAIIKCDIAGKGIPAALLMIQVATMFLNYFKEWDSSRQGIHIEDAVYQINSFIETLGFIGRFAAFTLCLFDSETGDMHFCNAGDNVVHICDTTEKCIKSITLPAAPAAGALPHSMVESKGGYQVQTVNLKHNDILLLYTDGIEEAKRSFRDESFTEMICAEGREGTPHGNHVAGEWGEELGSQRVYDIVNAVLRRETYTLQKCHNPEGEQELQFDYSLCNGKAEEVIMALMAAQKLFRCYKHPKATENDLVLVDKKIDVFLKRHFVQYQQYFTHSREHLGNNSYMYYTHMMEDEQYDDLCILGVRRK